MKKLLLSFLAVILLCAFTTVNAQNIRYVKENGSGDGSSWASASGDLQLTINSSEVNDQVWVAGGTYYPIRRADGLNTVSINDRNNAFVLKKDVKIFGGFAGINETALTQRDSTRTTNNTILSGDLGTIGDSTDNAYHVVISAADVGTAELNGFSVKDGNANGPDGVYIVISAEWISPRHGGGIINSNSSPALINITISRNTAIDLGGGIYNPYSSPLLTNVIIIGNKANHGGGIYNGYYSTAVLTKVTVIGNNAANGGGIYNAVSSPLLTDVKIIGNNADRGGGIYNFSSSSPLLTNVTISENTGSLFGGGIYNASSSPVLTNVTISGNNSNQGGGFYNNSSSSPILTNVIISGNTATWGGGIQNVTSSSPVLTNVTISGNNATTSGGGIYNQASSSPKIRNTIIYGNSHGIYNNASTPVITYSLVQGLTGESNGNISGSKDPLFVDPITPGLSTDGDYRLKSIASPAYDRGSTTFYSMDSIPNLSAIITDLDDNPRNSETIDMGAFESISPINPTNGIAYVTVTGSGDFTGSSWANASNDLQQAIYAKRVQQVWVSGGTYLPKYRADNMSNTNPNDRNNAFLLKRNVKIYGGFAGTETTLSTRDLSNTTNASILSGNLGNLTINTDNAFHVVISAGDVGAAELDGFSINDANANGTTSIIVSSLGINSKYGGGIYNRSSSPTLTNVHISGNNADTRGGGIFNEASFPVLTNVTINGNKANYGGGIYNSASSPMISNVSIRGNNANNEGGGIYNVSSSSPVFTNVIFGGNNADLNGGGIFNSSSNPILTNVTISGNNANRGGAIYNSSATSSPKIRNTIIYGNSDGIFNNSSTPVITYSIVQGLTDESNGNISGDKNPLFVNPLSPGLNIGGDYQLNSNESPAYNSGSITFYSSGSVPDLSAITTDLNGNTRSTETIGMGAYEYSSALPVTIAKFAAQAEANRTKLTWTTAIEINNKEFIISRSADGINFSELGSVSGAGNTNTKRDYLYYDESPMTGNNFYQLEQLDFDGRRTVAGIRNVQFATLSRINIYPNPVKHTLHLEFKSGIYQKSELTDVNGRLLKVSKIGVNDTKQELNLSTVTSGTYFLRLTGNGQVETRRVVKE